MILLTSHALTQLDRVGASADGEIHWKSTLLPTATLSSCESEYVALTIAAQEASYLRNLQIQMQGPSTPAVPICIYIDRQLAWTWSTILSTTPGVSSFRRDITL